jgi:hypothetical protein
MHVTRLAAAPPATSDLRREAVMLKKLRIRLAERRYDRAIGEAIAYSRGARWHVTVQTALNERRDRAAADYAAALLS